MSRMSRLGEWAKENQLLSSAAIVASALIIVLVPLWCSTQGGDPPPSTTTQTTTVPPQDETADAGEAPESEETTTTTSSLPPEPEDAGTTTTTVLQEEPENQEALDAYKFDVELGGCAGVSGSDQWCFYGGHATSYVAWRLNEVNFASTDEFFHNRYLMDVSDRWGHATEWDDAARRLGITVDGHPVPGSVAQWESGTGTTYGFVAYVEEVHYDSDGDVSSVVLSYMNTDREAVTTVPDTWTLEEEGFCSRTECDLDLEWPHSFIHIKDLDSSSAS